MADNRLLHRLLRFRQPLTIATHLALIPLGYVLAFGVRFDFQIPEQYVRLLWVTLPFLLVARLVAFVYFGLHRRYARHFGLPDVVVLLKAVTLGTTLFAAVLFLVGLLRVLPRSVLVLDWASAIFLAGGLHLTVRYLWEGKIPLRTVTGKRTLIIGAGEAAERLLRQLQHDSQSRMYVVGLVDDEPTKQRTFLHGVPVLGATTDLPRIVARRRIESLVIAIPSATAEQMRQIVDRCVATGIEFKIAPSFQELLAGRVARVQLRSVQIEDLLVREAVKLDLEQVERDVASKVVLITGGAGSIGSELARQLAQLRPAQLILLEQAESPLYFTHLELAAANPEVDVESVIGSVTDERRLEQVFATYNPEYVFHAAAYKHVPMMEANVIEAVRTNVFGTLRVAHCAASYGARKFVLLSTDKAVKPSSVMGATKRIAERIVLEWPTLCASTTDFRVVRFGNVLGSDGSVVPLFKRQIEAGGPLTITHPEVKRYFMTIPEAAQLVLEAAAIPAVAGRIAMLEMGEAIRIVDLAEQLIRLSGLEPYRDIEIRFTGLRPGEKLDEELTYAMETTVPTTVEKVRVVERSETDETVGLPIEIGLDRLAAASLLGSSADLVLEICALVPECVSPLRDLAWSAAKLKAKQLQSGQPA